MDSDENDVVSSEKDDVASQKKEKSRKVTGILVVAAFVLGIIVSGFTFYLLPILPSMATTTPAAGEPAAPAETGAIADIVERTSPAVVMIRTKVESRGNIYGPFLNDPYLRDFFERRIPMDTGPQFSSGVGSGFIVSKEGYILTNEHVIAGAKEIEVIIAGSDTPIPAKLIGSDFDLDLAVLKINGRDDLPALELGDSNAVKVGEWTIAIGNPHGLDHTVTVGVISAKERPISVQDRQYNNLLQTDASINPGNSGGPLLNTKGQVIGINTAVSASAQGIGFAIPSSTVRPVLDTLINQGKITRPWLGVYIQSVDEDIADHLKMESPAGVLVTSVIEGGPADRAGIKQGDVITEIDRQKVSATGDLASILEKMKPGQMTEFGVYREGKKMVVNITVGEKGKEN